MEKELRFFLTNREGAKGAKEEKKEDGLSLIEWLYNRDIWDRKNERTTD